jgi:hypothetical protein
MRQFYDDRAGWIFVKIERMTKEDNYCICLLLLKSDEIPHHYIDEIDTKHTRATFGRCEKKRKLVRPHFIYFSFYLQQWTIGPVDREIVPL